MAEANHTVTSRPVGDMLVASIRFRGAYEEVPERLQQLYQEIQPHVSGKGMMLHYYFDESVGEGHDLEVCFPVSRPVESRPLAAGKLQTRTLQGAQMLCATHVGPHGPRGEPGSLLDAWQQVFGHVRQYGVIIDAVPRREVYMEDSQEHGSDVERYVTEVQLPYAFYRMERLAENLEAFAGEQVRRQVMAGSEDYPSMSLPEKARWFKEAMERLDGLVDDENSRRDILITCADRFPRPRIQGLREMYQRDGDIDALLTFMGADRTLGDLSWYETPVREGNVIYVSKDPALPDQYREAVTQEEKRAAYCHCGLLREAIRAGLTMSGTYCYCGAGWYKQLWEGILDQPVQIDVLESILQGDDRCSFAIHLPPGAVPPA